MADINISFNCSDIEAFQKAMEQLCDHEIEQMYKDTCKDFTKSLLSKVKKNTDTGKAPDYIDDDVYAKYWSGYTGGQLKDSWHPQAIEKKGSNWTCGIETNVEYALYYEYGHRQDVGRLVPQLGLALKKPFVEGKHPVENAMGEMRKQFSKIADKNIRKALRRLEDYDK